jgi:hypothetical protein
MDCQRFCFGDSLPCMDKINQAHMGGATYLKQRNPIAPDSNTKGNGA